MSSLTFWLHSTLLLLSIICGYVSESIISVSIPVDESSISTFSMSLPSISLLGIETLIVFPSTFTLQMEMSFIPTRIIPVYLNVSKELNTGMSSAFFIIMSLLYLYFINTSSAHLIIRSFASVSFMVVIELVTALYSRIDRNETVTVAMTQ